jgi:hypothetical protein
MTRRRLSMLVLLAMAGAAVGVLANPLGRAASNADETLDAKAVTSNTVITRGDARTIQIIYNSNSNGLYTVVAAAQIDVTSITLANGIFGTGVADPGGVQIATAAAENKNFLFLATPGYGTQHLTFDPPLRLRTGDRIFFVPNTANSITSEWDLTLHGRVPPAKSDGVAIQ